MSDIRAWLTAQLDHDELQIRAVVDHLMEGGTHGIDIYALPDVLRHYFTTQAVPRHSEAVVKAHRAILERHSACGFGTGRCDDSGNGWDPIERPGGVDGPGCAEIQDLASAYAGRDGFNPEWLAE